MRGALVDSLEQLRPRNGYTRPLAPRRDPPPPRVVFTPRPWRFGELAIAIIALLPTLWLAQTALERVSASLEPPPLAASAPAAPPRAPTAVARAGERMALPRAAVQELLLRQLAARGAAVESPLVQLAAPDRVVVTGKSGPTSVRIELRLGLSDDGRPIVLAAGHPAVGSDDISRAVQSLLPAGSALRRLAIENDQLVVELR